MIVKVVPRELGLPLVSATHFQVDRAINSGTHYFDDEPEQRAYSKALGIDHDGTLLHVIGIEGGHDHLSGLDKGWTVRFAWWRTPGDHIEAVVTSGEIYLLSDAGHTVDKVR